jgi:hypothetical protein
MFGIEKQALIDYPPMQQAATACFDRLVSATVAATGGDPKRDARVLQRANAI